jgi:hypothetical protein
MSKLHPKPEGVPKYRGVRWDSRKGMWHCQILVDWKYVCLGWYTNPLTAAMCYDSAHMRSVEAGGVLKSNSKTNAELGLIDPLSPRELELMYSLIDQHCTPRVRPYPSCPIRPTSGSCA